MDTYLFGLLGYVVARSVFVNLTLVSFMERVLLEVDIFSLVLLLI